jgi:hypothetical protein
MKFPLRLATLAFLAVLSASSLHAIEISEDLRIVLQRDVEAIEQDGPLMSDAMIALREVGASYLPELVAPADVDRYQTPERKRQILGAYLMDLTYAATFGRQEPTARYGQAIYRLLGDLGYPNPGMERRYREALEQIDLPGGDERLRQLAEEQDNDTAWQDMLRSGEGVEIVADGLYGFLVEGLHLTTELCVLSGYDPAFMAYVGYMRDSFEAYKRLLHRIGENEELARLVQDDDKLDFLATILFIYADLPQLGPAQIDSLRPAIQKARREIVD